MTDDTTTTHAGQPEAQLDSTRPAFGVPTVESSMDGTVERQRRLPRSDTTDQDDHQRNTDDVAKCLGDTVHPVLSAGASDVPRGRSPDGTRGTADGARDDIPRDRPGVLGCGAGGADGVLPGASGSLVDGATPAGLHVLAHRDPVPSARGDRARQSGAVGAPPWSTATADAARGAFSASGELRGDTGDGGCQQMDPARVCPDAGPGKVQGDAEPDGLGEGGVLELQLVPGHGPESVSGGSIGSQEISRQVGGSPGSADVEEEAETALRETAGEVETGPGGAAPSLISWFEIQIGELHSAGDAEGEPDVNKVYAIITCGDRKFWLSHTQAPDGHGISGDLRRLMTRVQIEALRALQLPYRTMTTKRVAPEDIAHHGLGHAIVHRAFLVRQENTTIDLADWRADCPDYEKWPDPSAVQYAYGQKREAPDPITDDAALDRELPPSYCSPYADFDSCNDTLRWYLPADSWELIACSDRGFGTDMQAFIRMRDHYFHYDASAGREFFTCLGTSWALAVAKLWSLEDSQNEGWNVVTLCDVEARGVEALFPLLEYYEEEWQPESPLLVYDYEECDHCDCCSQRDWLFRNDEAVLDEEDDSCGEQGEEEDGCTFDAVFDATSSVD
ncbi:hypothetical protein FN846DRAFT_983554 [Sphaerosporella brunnea]|uniref:Uncharacterized protein n=1 Tax=Sphaerosporella brunnea TaxID=1250544 RepID=A0A5J5F9M7_9PEZI|nr:hypothetical protein FN846DRAFT_983554 [Sphaerosporella brunnea]